MPTIPSNSTLPLLPPLEKVHPIFLLIARAAQHKLLVNRHKTCPRMNPHGEGRTWKDLSVDWLYGRAAMELGELGGALDRRTRIQNDALYKAATLDLPEAEIPSMLKNEYWLNNWHMIQEAGDVLNFLMMILDNTDAAKAYTDRAQENGWPKPEDIHGIDCEHLIFFYEQDYYVFSNFSAFEVNWRGFAHKTSEHAYQWARFQGGVEDWKSIAQSVFDAPSAHEAFKLAQEHKALQNPEWNRIKLGVMKEILNAKFDQHAYVRKKLKDSGNRRLIENSWRDDFWGWGEHKDGENHLGRLWMEIRKERFQS